MGLAIPLVGSIVPIQVALGKQLSEQMNYTRSKTKGQKVNVSSANSLDEKLPYLIFGTIGSLSGMIVYYFLPASILNFNPGLLLEIFFLILIGLILGLALIAFNLQRLFEKIILHTILFFETKSMKILIEKNLSAHRESNRLTSIIYSLTLGAIIFVVVASNL